LHSGHSRDGIRNSTTAAALMTFISRDTDIAASIVSSFQRFSETHMGITLSFSPEVCT
jgi:hypothetical protein